MSNRSLNHCRPFSSQRGRERRERGALPCELEHSGMSWFHETTQNRKGIFHPYSQLAPAGCDHLRHAMQCWERRRRTTKKKWQKGTKSNRPSGANGIVPSVREIFVRLTRAFFASFRVGQSGRRLFAFFGSFLVHIFPS